MYFRFTQIQSKRSLPWLSKDFSGKILYVMKKFILLIFTLFFAFSCAKEKTSLQEKLIKDALVVLIISETSKTLSNSCRDYSGKANKLYYTDYYEGKFKSDTTKYTNIIIGDSSMDYSARLSGYLSLSSQSVAVAGNTLCDMQEQLPVINSTSPTWIVIGTLGGNDVLKKIDNTNIIKTGKSLYSNIRAKFPSIKLAGIGIHPTRVDYANSNRTIVNDALKLDLDCYINPDEFFTIETDGKASTGDLLENDEIHYNTTVAFKIKSKMASQCNINL